MTTRLAEIKLAEIKRWLTGLFPDDNLNELHYIQADASDRKYLRLSLLDKSYIIMDTKPGQEMRNFINLAKILQAHNINAPQIIASSPEQGLLIMNDFGTQTYLNILKHADIKTANRLYTDAIIALIKIQNIQIDNLPSMNSEYIANRMEVFKTWYLQKHLNFTINHKIQSMLNDLQELFINTFQEQPPVLVHLDYHCRNLMYLEQAHNPGILDFQDAMFGPPSYDLVSLFQDAYIVWSRAQVEAWVNLYNTLSPKNPVTMRNFDLVGLQRHIKNLGIFARLHYRDHKSNYLQDIPTLLNYITETCNSYPELTALGELIAVVDLV